MKWYWIFCPGGEWQKFWLVWIVCIVELAEFKMVDPALVEDASLKKKNLSWYAKSFPLTMQKPAYLRKPAQNSHNYSFWETFLADGRDFLHSLGIEIGLVISFWSYKGENNRKYFQISIKSQWKTVLELLSAQPEQGN